MKNKTLFNKAKIILCFIMLGMLPFSLMGQCPTSVTDDSATIFAPPGTQYLFEVPGCGIGLPISITSDGGGTYGLGSCNPGPPALQAYTGGPPDPLPAVFQFGGAIGDCEYDAAGNLVEIEIPTLSEWGLLILALLFMTMGTLYLINNKQLAFKE